MVGLVFSEAILFLVACAIGFAIGWRLRAFLAESRQLESEDELILLRSAISEARVRRARPSHE